MIDKQIEMHELAKQMSEAISTAVEQRYIEDEAKLEAVLRANGWRKVTDVAREISQDIIEPLWNAYKNSTCQETVLLVALICETINNQLKKKYESEGEG